MSINGRLAKLLARLELGRRRTGPTIRFFDGTAEELDALELPDVCDRCGEPLAGHPPGPPYIICVVRSDGEPERNGDGD